MSQPRTTIPSAVTENAKICAVKAFRFTDDDRLRIAKLLVREVSAIEEGDWLALQQKCMNFIVHSRGLKEAIEVKSVTEQCRKVSRLLQDLSETLDWSSDLARQHFLDSIESQSGLDLHDLRRQMASAERAVKIVQQESEALADKDMHWPERNLFRAIENWAKKFNVRRSARADGYSGEDKNSPFVLLTEAITNGLPTEAWQPSISPSALAKRISRKLA